MARRTTTPWTIPLSSLSTTPGHSQDVDVTMPAPTGIGDDVIGVREGADVAVRGRIDSVVDGVLLTADVTAPVHASCSRCLTPLDHDWTTSITMFFPYDSSAIRDDAGDDELDIIAGEEESGDVYPLCDDGATMSLEAPLRDTLAEMLPLQPLCRENCKGLCPECGLNLNDNPGHHHDVTDIRFAELQGLRDRLLNQTEDQTEKGTINDVDKDDGAKD